MHEDVNNMKNTNTKEAVFPESAKDTRKNLNNSNFDKYEIFKKNMHLLNSNNNTNKINNNNYNNQYFNHSIYNAINENSNKHLENNEVPNININNNNDFAQQYNNNMNIFRNSNNLSSYEVSSFNNIKDLSNMNTSKYNSLNMNIFSKTQLNNKPSTNNSSTTMPNQLFPEHVKNNNINHENPVTDNEEGITLYYNNNNSRRMLY